MKEKLTLTKVKDFIEIESNSGCKLLSTEYINSKSNLKIKCKCGNTFLVRLGNFRTGKRQCNECSGVSTLPSILEIKKYIEDESTCKLLSSEYTNAKQMLRFKCGCGNEFETTYSSFKWSNKKQCNDCGMKIRSMSRTLTLEHIKNFIEVESNSGCKLISEIYISAKDDLEIECACGEPFFISWDRFYSVRRRECSECRKKMMSLKFELEEDKLKKEIKILSSSSLVNYRYVDGEHQITLLCKCGTTFNITWYRFKNGKTMCNICSKEKQSLESRDSHDTFIKKTKEAFGDKYTILGRYIKSNEKILIRNNDCGHEYHVIPNNIQQGNGCAECDKHKKRSHNDFVEHVYELVEEEYEVMSEYINSETHIIVKHNKCGNSYLVKPSNFSSGRRCPRCRASKGEKKIEEILKGLNISYLPEYRFLECKYKYTLPFDFLIEGKVLIEYDGDFHFVPARYSNDKELMIEKLKETQIKDKIKNQYCIDNNIPLIRIPYWEFDNLKTLLISMLSFYGLLDSKDLNLTPLNTFLEWSVDSSWCHDDYVNKAIKNERE